MSDACRNWLVCLLVFGFVAGCDETSVPKTSTEKSGLSPRSGDKDAADAPARDEDAAAAGDMGDAGEATSTAPDDQAQEEAADAGDTEPAPSKGGTGGKGGGKKPTHEPAPQPDAGKPVEPLAPVAGTADSAHCSSTSPAENGMCGSFYCGVTAAQLEAEAVPDRKCKDVAFACSAKLDTVTSKCARDAALRTGSTNIQSIWPMIRDCALSDRDVGAHVDAACTDCLLDSLQCTARSCLLTCASDGPLCDDCARRNGCFDSLASCAGLPSPF